MFVLQRDLNSSHDSFVFLLEFGIFFCCIGAIYACLGRVYIRPNGWRNSNRGGWIYRKSEPNDFGGTSGGILSLALS